MYYNAMVPHSHFKVRFPNRNSQPVINRLAPDGTNQHCQQDCCLCQNFFGSTVWLDSALRIIAMARSMVQLAKNYRILRPQSKP